MGWESFKIHPALHNSLVKSGFIKPAPVQERALIYTNFQVDLIIAAKTGSGKTLCYLIPMLNKLFNQTDEISAERAQAEENNEPVEETEPFINALVLLPTRELAVQVLKVLDKILENLEGEENQKNYRFLRCLISGGFAVEKQERLLGKTPQILIATVGRLWDLVKAGQHPELKTLALSTFLILDEVDRILELGQFKELANVLKFLDDPNAFETFQTFSQVTYLNSIEDIPNQAPDPSAVPLTEDELIKQMDNFEQQKASTKVKTNKSRRTFVVSATLGKSFGTSRVMNKRVRKKFKKLMKENPEVQPNMKLREIMHKINFKNKTKIIDLTKETILPETLELLKVDCLKEEKMLYLYHFIRIHQGESIIVFTNSINSTKRVKSLLDLGGFKCICLHAQMQMRQRIKKLDQFRAGKFKILVCTDVASRGLDVPEVNVVLHLHTPKDADTMVHRCGRTARQGREGLSVIISDANDRKRLVKYRRDLDQGKIKNIKVPIQKLDEIRDVVEQVSAVEREEFKHGLEAKDRSWEKKMAEAAGIVLDKKTEGQKIEEERKESQLRKKKNALKKRIKGKKMAKFNKSAGVKRRNVFLSPADIALINEEMKLAKRKPQKKKRSTSTAGQSKASNQKQGANQKGGRGQNLKKKRKKSQKKKNKTK